MTHQPGVYVPLRALFLVFGHLVELPYGMKHTVQEFLLHHDLLGVQIFHIMEKGLFIVQMIKRKANNVCMRGQDN